MNDSTIKYLFEPRTVAVIGASAKPEKIGHQILNNIISSGYCGKVYPVNPSGGEILGRKVFGSVVDIPDEIDMAVITIPAKLVLDEIKKCAVKRARNAVIITSGFSEVGNSAMEREIISYAASGGVRVLGPNIFGIYSASASLNATFGPKDIKQGNIAIITQSGAIGIAMIGKTKAENLGLSAIVSVGNKADIGEAELIEYLMESDSTKIILIYIEGVQHGEAFAKALKEATRRKPVVVIKSGRSKRGAMAAASHTGSLAGADSVFDDIAVKQCGVIRAENIQDALNWCRFLDEVPLPQGGNSVIITNGGGIGVLAADACEKYDVKLYDDVERLKEAFSSVMPDFGSAKNPIDITGSATADDYNKALQTALMSDDIHSVICLGCETAAFNSEAFAKTMENQYMHYKGKKPIVFSVFGGEEVERHLNSLSKRGIPVYPDVYKAVSCMGALCKHYKNVNTPAEVPAKADVNIGAVCEIVRRVKGEKRNFLLANEARAVMDSAGITVPKSRIAKNIDDAIRFSEEIGYPVVLKVVSKDIIHKSDAGGVALDLHDSSEVVDAYESIMYNCRAYKRDAKIEGVSVDEMIAGGVETIVGARRDKSFGPVVMFGLGGIYVEVMKDVSFRAFPLSREEVYKMISEIKSYPLLLGVRGGRRKDIDATVDVIIKVGTILEECRDIDDIEINPLVVYDYGEGIKAVDVRIIIGPDLWEVAR